MRPSEIQAKKGEKEFDKNRIKDEIKVAWYQANKSKEGEKQQENKLKEINKQTLISLSIKGLISLIKDAD